MLDTQSILRFDRRLNEALWRRIRPKSLAESMGATSDESRISTRGYWESRSSTSDFPSCAKSESSIADRKTISDLLLEITTGSETGDPLLVPSILSILASLPEGESATQGFSIDFGSQRGEEGVDWDRWHELLDIRDERVLTPAEQEEYERIARIVAQLDEEEARIAAVTLDRLRKQHDSVLDSIRALTDKLKAAANRERPH